jgi:hypothetical protein
MRVAQGVVTTMRDLHRDTRGAVYVEFILAFIPLFFMFLGMLQMGLLYGASLIVQHASNVAVRAAMVVMDDDPEHYDGAARRAVDTESTGISSGVEEAGAALGAIFGSSTAVAWTGGPRQQAIELAAGVPLLPISPSLLSLARMPEDETVRAALGVSGMDSPESRIAWGLAYNQMALAVTFPSSPGESSHVTEFPLPTDAGDGGAVTARVTYLYNCQIPLANRLMCDDLWFIRFGVDPSTAATLAMSFARGELSYDQLQDALHNLAARSDRRGRWSPRMDELGERVNMLATIGGVSSALGGPSPRFVPITAEATMPMQSSNYCYVGEDATDGCWEQPSEVVYGEGE